jgi:cytochrome c-type protein NapB
METISSARFNCTACHAPQSTGELAVENTFKPTFTRKDGKTHSTWNEVMTKDLDTLKQK